MISQITKNIADMIKETASVTTSKKNIHFFETIVLYKEKIILTICIRNNVTIVIPIMSGACNPSTYESANGEAMAARISKKVIMILILKFLSPIIVFILRYPFFNSCLISRIIKKCSEIIHS